MKRVIILFLILFANFVAGAQKITPYYGPFPEPAPNNNMLFYLQRTVDRNTVIYELNYDAGGQLNEKKPVKVYWIDFENGAKISQLTFVQNTFAYGVSSELIDKDKKIYEINLVSYKKIKFYLKPSGVNNHYQTHAVIKGKPAILKRVFISIIGGTQFNPIISYIELIGNDLQSGLEILEQIKPDRD